jgi:hypothetical protein
MSAGSAFAAGLRSGQAIYDSAVRNAMARKRFDMAKAEFKYQQAQRKQAIEDEVAATTAFDKAKDFFSSGELKLKNQADRDTYNNVLLSVEPEIMRHKPTFDQYERFIKVFEEKEGLPLMRDRERQQRTIIANYLDNSSEQEPLYKRDKDNNFILNTEGKPQFDMSGMIQFNLKTEADRQRQLKDIEFGGGGMERFFGSKPSNLSPGLRERYIISRNNYFDKIKSGGNTDDIVQASYVWDEAPSQSESESLDKFKFTSDRIAELKTQLEGEATGPVMGIIRSANPFDEKARLIKAQITKIIPGLARGVFGEVGVLTDQDVAMYSRTIGNLSQPEEVNEALTKAAMDMVARGFEDKLVTMAKNRKNVSGYLDTLKDIKAKRSVVLGEEEEEPAASVEVDNLQLTDDGQPVISEELAEQLRATNADTVEVVDQATGTKRKIKINRVKAPAPQAPAAPTPNPPAEPVDKAFDALFGPGSIDASQSEVTTDTRDRKQQIETRIGYFQELLDELGRPRTRESKSKKEKRRKYQDAIQKNKDILKTL